MSSDFPNLTVVMHPLVQHKLTWLRSADTNTDSFRNLLREVSQMLIYEATRDLPTELQTIHTPVAEMRSPVISGKKLCIVSILRAGNGMLDGVLALLPLARVGHIGLYRDPETLEPVEYYFKVPSDIAERQVIVVDPMLATGNSAVAAIDRIKESGCPSIKLISLLGGLPTDKSITTVQDALSSASVEPGSAVVFDILYSVTLPIGMSRRMGECHCQFQSRVCTTCLVRSVCALTKCLRVRLQN